MLKDLQDLGLSEKEARVYLASLEIGRATADQLGKHAKIKRPTTYVQLESLMKVGLMSTYEENKKTYFAPESPELLKRLLAKQREGIGAKEKNLASFLPELLRQFESAGERPVVRFFPGKEGVAHARGNPITMKDPEGLWGFFFQGDLSGAAGLGSGFAGTVSAGGGFVTDQNPFTDPTEVGGYTSYGGLAGGAFHSTTLEGSRRGPNPYTTLGLSGGPGVGITLTNATRMSQISGPSVSNNITAGIASFSWSRNPQTGVWTVTMSIGGKPGLSFSSYPTDTKTTTAATTEKKNDKKK